MPPTHRRPHRVLRAYSSLLSFFPRWRGFRFCNVNEWAWVHHWANIARNWERSSDMNRGLNLVGC